ncbi:MAG: hypothetical protein HC837_01870 [Chloroflexaceae bacterium]|nr:hypothetical protein [Chloroflexaceae bacterium]
MSPGTQLYCSYRETGQWLGDAYEEADGTWIDASDQWLYCPDYGGYIFAELLKPL